MEVHEEVKMQQSEETTGASSTGKKSREAIDYKKLLSEIYDNQIWCINQINSINTWIAGLQSPQQSQPYYPVQLPQEEPPALVVPANAPSFTPSFTKRTSPVQPLNEPKETPKKPWYKQKGIIFAIILAIVVIYLVYIMIAKSQGHTITIPGLGKF